MIVGTTLGAGLMYFLDPERGARRRARMMERAIHSAHRTGSYLNKASRDLTNRTYGVLAGARNFISLSNTLVEPDILTARVRSKLGRYVSHPHAIEVSANQNGHIILRGLILAHEINRLITNLKKVPGVQEVRNELEIHKQEDSIPSLQGGNPKPGERPDIFQANWAPGTRVLVGVLGTFLTGYGIRKEGFLPKTLGIIGGLSLLRALNNLELMALFGLTGRKNAIRVHKTININAPRERVFEFWSNFENFPKFMTEVNEVRTYNNNQSRWTVNGPAGTPVHWDAIITRALPNQIISWKTLPGSLIPHAGIVRFSHGEHGGTRVDLDLAYCPPAGALGHFAAILFGADPKSKFDEALAQMKTLMEQGPSERQLRQIA